jgi:hypothetical protein
MINLGIDASIGARKEPERFIPTMTTAETVDASIADNARQRFLMILIKSSGFKSFHLYVPPKHNSYANIIAGTVIITGFDSMAKTAKTTTDIRMRLSRVELLEGVMRFSEFSESFVSEKD